MLSTEVLYFSLVQGLLMSVTSVLGTFHPKSYQYNPYKSGPNPHHSSGKPVGRHKNYCAFMVEKSVSFTAQDGVAPYVKAEYRKCAWGQKCPALMYRMIYKPKYKVAYKPVTEIEWRCCPGFSGVGCTSGPAGLPHGMKAMPPFNRPMPPFKGQPSAHKEPMPSSKAAIPSYKGPMPSYKGQMPSYKGPMPSYKGPMPSYKGPIPSYKGPMPVHKGPMPSYEGPVPSYKGPVPQASYKGSPWNQPKGPPTNTHSYTVPEVGQPMESHQVTSFDSYEVNQEHTQDHPGQEHHDPIPENHDLITDHHEPIPDQNNPQPDQHDLSTSYHDALPDHDGSLPSHHETPEKHAPPTDSQSIYDHVEDGVMVERLDRMDEDVQRLSRGLETLRGTVTGLEDGLRASLREDANRMISALLSAVPHPLAAPALSSRDSSIGFGDLPGGGPEADGLDGSQFPGLGDLVGKVEQLRAELQTKATELEELRGTVLGHDGTLRRLIGGSTNLTGTPESATSQQDVEKQLESKLSGARAAILGGFETRIESAEERCEGRAAEVRRQCQTEQIEGRGQIEQVLEGSAAGLRRELGSIQAQLQDLDQEEGCCSRMSGLAERVSLLELSVGGLNRSQTHLQAELGGHKDHVEGMLEGRLGYVEATLNLTGKTPAGESKVTSSTLETRLESKLRALEGRLFAAVDELGNVTAPALLEGQVVPTLETEVESLRKRVAVDVDRVQKHLSSLEILCTSSCAPRPILTGNPAPVQADEGNEDDAEKNLTGRLELQAGRLDRLNASLEGLLAKVAERKADEENDLQGEVTLLRFSVHSVNRSLLGLRNSLGMVVQEVGHTNTTWQEREERLAQQVRGVVQLVGRQASMLGAGERKLSRLKGELQELRRRLAGELQGCRSTALGVQREVTEVGGRVARVEGQCEGMAHLAEDLERIRGELERHSDGYLSQVNGTLASHSVQLSELREGLKNCTTASDLIEPRRNWLPVPTKKIPEQHAGVQAQQPRGDQYAVPDPPISEEKSSPQKP